MHRGLQRLDLPGIACHRVETRLDAVHAVHEEGEVDRGTPGDRVPGHRQRAREHAVEALGRDRGPAVAGEEAASLADDLGGGNHGFRDAAATWSIAS